MFNLKDEFIYIIKKTHEWLELPYGKDQLAIMMGTAATESHLGQKLRQSGYSMKSKGGAFGPWQQQLNSHDDIWRLVFFVHPKLCERVKQINGCIPARDALIGNLYYACAMARLQYWRHPEPLPSSKDLEGQGRYYIKYFNCGGKGSVAKYVADYKQFVL